MTKCHAELIIHGSNSSVAVGITVTGWRRLGRKDHKTNALVVDEVEVEVEDEAVSQRPHKTDQAHPTRHSTLEPLWSQS